MRHQVSRSNRAAGAIYTISKKINLDVWMINLYQFVSKSCD